MRQERKQRSRARWLPSRLRAACPAKPAELALVD